jgi:hypothetical protein
MEGGSKALLLSNRVRLLSSLILLRNDLESILQC